MDRSIQELVSKHPGISAERLYRLLETISGNGTIPAAAKSALYGRLRRLKRAGRLINKGPRWYFVQSSGSR